jgi:hypothetical protein
VIAPKAFFSERTLTFCDLSLVRVDNFDSSIQGIEVF